MCGPEMRIHFTSPYISLVCGYEDISATYGWKIQYFVTSRRVLGDNFGRCRHRTNLGLGCKVCRLTVDSRITFS